MPTPSLVPLVKQIRIATRIGLAEAKAVAAAAIDAGLGMAGVHASTVQQAIIRTGVIDDDLADIAAEALVRLYPDAHLAGKTVTPLENLRSWLDDADALGDYALVPLPGKPRGRKLTVLDLRILLEEADRTAGI